MAVLAPLALVLASCAPTGAGDAGGEDDGTAEFDGAAEATSVENLTREDVEGASIDYLYFTDGPDQAVTEELITAFEEEYGATVDLLDLTPYVGEDYLETFIEGLRPPMEHEGQIIAVPSDLTMNGPVR